MTTPQRAPHGFWKSPPISPSRASSTASVAPNIQRSPDAELYFYSRIFAFALADAVHPVPSTTCKPILFGLS